MDELTSANGFKMRATCLHPGPKISGLPNKLKARMWRYIREAVGASYYTELATIIAAVELDDDGHLRVKEIFESIEAYKVISLFIVAAQKTNNNEIKNVVEFASGHGLVGTLLAYRFPNLVIHQYDLFKRPTYDAYVRAFERYGVKRTGKDKVLPNIIFHEQDVKESISNIPNSIVVCIHGCGVINELAVQYAETYNGSGWIVMPCCIDKNMYLGDHCSMQSSDDNLRHHILCGAIGNQYTAQLITSIDTRITNRAIIIAGGIGNNKMR